MEYIERATLAEPDNVDLWIWNGAYSVLIGEYADAELAFEEALDLMGSYDTMTAKRYSVLQSIQVPLQMQQKDEEALRYAQTVAESPQGQFLQTYENAVTSFQEGDIVGAEAELSRVLALVPDDPNANILMGLAQYEAGDYIAAQESLSRFVNEVTTTPQPIRALAATQLRLNRPDLAIDTLNRALSNFPEDASLFSMIGLAQQQLGDLESSIISFEKALEIQPENADTNLALSSSYYLLGDLVSTQDQLLNAIELDPGLNQAKSNLINLYAEQDNLEVARSSAMRWLDSEPNSTFHNILVALVEIADGNYNDARTYLNTSIELDSSNILPRMLLARLAATEENFTEAESILDEVLARSPTNPEALSGLLTLGATLGTLEEKVAQVESIVENFPDAIEPPLVLSAFYTNTNNLEDALQYAEIALERNENDSTRNAMIQVLLAQATQARVQNDLVSATNLVEEALELNEDNIAALTVATGIAVQLSEFEKAENYIETIKTLQPNSSFGFEIEGDLYIEREFYTQATDAFQQAWEFSKTAQLGSKLYRAYLASGQNDEANLFLSQWLVEMPENATVNMFAGMVKQEQGLVSESQEHYEIALNEQPENAIALNNLAWLYMEPEPERALELASRAAELYPDNPDILDTYGWILFNQGEAELAAEFIQQAYELAPDSEAIAEHLAEVVN